MLDQSTKEYVHNFTTFDLVKAAGRLHGAKERNKFEQLEVANELWLVAERHEAEECELKSR
ncbi:hypothetical protein RvY_07152 [Ramazzottius varieornatus]|uniref:Uncharacterized protein n=1 Tax=Ramazzottius varieornatus TaxID=947166 RepID=A0A1D1V674_RAMVA|nr:hypothetical protein RvY_07152 [Ramazzottius varieornatus]